MHTLAWGWSTDGARPDHGEVAGGAFAFVGVGTIMLAPGADARMDPKGDPRRPATDNWVLRINESRTTTQDVVEAAREQLVIGHLS